MVSEQDAWSGLGSKEQDQAGVIDFKRVGYRALRYWYFIVLTLAVALSVTTFIAWWILIGVSTEDNRVFWWLGLNGLLLVVIQPWLMRLSRVIYLYFFVSYDPDYKKTKPVEFDHKQ